MKLKTLSALLLSGAVFFLASCGNESAEGEASGEECNPCAPADEAASGSYSINTEKSVVKWEGTMTKVGGVALYGHNGIAKLKDGSITLEDGKISGGTLTVDMTSLEATDQDEFGYTEEKTPEMLIGHLSDSTFFYVEKYPEATFAIKSVEGDVITGDLTIRGITEEQEVTGVTTKVAEDGTLTASGNLTFNRQKYNASFSMSSMNVTDKLIDDEVSLDIELTASPAEAQ